MGDFRGERDPNPTPLHPTPEKSAKDVTCVGRTSVDKAHEYKCPGVEKAYGYKCSSVDLWCFHSCSDVAGTLGWAVRPAVSGGHCGPAEWLLTGGRAGVERGVE